MKALILALLCLLLSGCFKPNALTDAQVSEIVAQCKILGMATRIFNGATSIVECVPVKLEKP